MGLLSPRLISAIAIFQEVVREHIAPWDQPLLQTSR
jgi:hypothetical protein